MAGSDGININVASQEEICGRCRVPPKVARLIVEQREKARFKSIDELNDLPGIGGRAVEHMKGNGCYAA